MHINILRYQRAEQGRIQVQESNKQTGSNKRTGCDILADCKQVKFILKSQIQ